MSKDVTELWGREFNIVKNGLSEDQVVSYVNQLVSEHDMLIQRQEHLSSLTKLAEKTVAEAEKLAEEIKTEALSDERVQRFINEKSIKKIIVVQKKLVNIVV